MWGELDTGEKVAMQWEGKQLHTEFKKARESRRMLRTETVILHNRNWQVFGKENDCLSCEVVTAFSRII